jgi:hypothetical protein
VRASVVGPVIGLAAMVAGCGATQPATAPPATGGDVAAVAFSSAEEAHQARTLAAAREQLIRRCMAGRGFAYQPAAPPPALPPADAAPSGAGYGLFAQFADAAPPRAAPRGASMHRALMGSPRQTGSLRLPGGAIVTYRSGGCYAHATGTLYGSVRHYQQLVWRRNAVRSAAGQRLATDPRLAGSLTGWTRCMSIRGFRYPSPDAARQGVYDAYLKASDRAHVRQRELATAAADRYCAERTAFYSELARAQRDAVGEMSTAERSAAAAIARGRAAALERARRIVISARDQATAARKVG